MNAPVYPSSVRTTCPYCGVGCGVLARPDGFGGALVQGDPDHPANFGRLCSKGSALGETLSLDGRLLHPMVRGADGAMQRTSWDQALDRVASGLHETIARHGPDSVAFYVSGQLLTEDYYVANKLMKGFIGSGNIDTNSRLCMASSVAGHRRAFGSDTVPGCYDDLDTADLLIFVGSNAAWCHPVLYQRMLKNKRERGAKIVVIDPRITPTADEADLVLQIAPGMDTVLFSGLLATLAPASLDHDFIANHTDGFGQALARARYLAPDVSAVAEACDLAEEDVAQFYQLFRDNEKTVTLYSQGVNQSAQGTDKVNAIVNCHLATGRIGRPGMGPFSLTGQPNAMGGREVGGLANQLAAHMDFDRASIERVGRFWTANRMAERPGLKAVDMFDAVASGRIKALWIIATNPAVSLPRAGAVQSALKKLDHLFISEVVQANDTTAGGADVLLPAAAWGEKDGTVTNSERRISRQRAFLPPPGDVKPDWWIVSEVGRRMGYGAAFAFQSAADVFKEHAELSAFENNGTRDFDLTGLTALSEDGYGRMTPVQWPATEAGSNGEARMFAKGGFFTSDRRARFISVATPSLSARGATGGGDGLPLLLNTGRVRDHWHTMTRTGKSARLSAHLDEPFVSINAADASKFGVLDGQFARVTTLYGTAVLRVRVSDGQRPGEIFAPIHWSATTSSDGRIGALVQPVCDPFSGQPELKATPAVIAPENFAVHGFILSRTSQHMPFGMWWSQSVVEGGIGVRFAAQTAIEDWPALARGLLGAHDACVVEHSDPARKTYRLAAFGDAGLSNCIFLSGEASGVPGWEWLKTQLVLSQTTASKSATVLAGRAAEAGSEMGPVVCACFGVGFNAIQRLVATGGATTAEIVGRHLKAGTNCGSCIPEIKRVIAAHL